jgi:TonB family protein
MNFLIDTTLKVTVLLVLGLVAAALLRSRSAALRHWLLGAVILGAAAAPVLLPIAPGWDLGTERATVKAPLSAPYASATARVALQTTPARIASESPERTPILVGRLAGLVWAGGTAVGLVMLLIGLARLSRLSRRSRRVPDGPWTVEAATLGRAMGMTRRIALVQNDHPSLPLTWGILRPTIILPTDAPEWSSERRRVVLLHELAHIQRGDWLTLVAAEGVRTMHWFNPFVWLACRRLRRESEQACDDVVLDRGVDGRAYAEHLLAIARTAAGRRALLHRLPAPAIGRPSSFERRFVAVLNGTLDRRPVSRMTRVLVATAVLIATVLIAGYGVAQTFSSFSGTVFDATNRFVPGVKLRLVNVESGARYEIHSDHTGRFEFVGLPAGGYTWEAGFPGFATRRGQLTVRGQSIRQDLDLRVGSLEETVTVNGGSPRAGQLAAVEKQNALARTVTDLAAARTRLQPISPPCDGGPRGGKLTPPRKVADAAPRYPDHLASSRTGGSVVLDITIEASGAVGDVAINGSAHQDLERAASEAVKQLQYTPALLNCTPVEIRARVRANFVSQP